MYYEITKNESCG